MSLFFASSPLISHRSDLGSLNLELWLSFLSIGEIGIPYDMDGKKAYGYGPDGKGKGDYSAQQKALDASLNAADGPNMLNWTVWTYCVDK